MTSFTSPKPPDRRPFKKAVQNAPSSESPTSTPRTSRSPVAETPVTTTTAPVDGNDHRTVLCKDPAGNRREIRGNPTGP
jgi:hypothetical protein